MSRIIGRRMIEREVTFTTVKVSKMVIEDGRPKAITLPNEVIIGNATMEQAQRIVNKRYGEPVTVFECQAQTQTYEMPVEEFIKTATVKQK